MEGWSSSLEFMKIKELKKIECERDIYLYITFHKVMAALSAGMKTRDQSPQWIRGLGQEN